MRPATRVRATSAASAIVIAAGLLFASAGELSAQNAPTVTVTPTTVAPGATVTVTIANGPGNTTDWVGIYTTTAPDTVMSDWKYLNGTRTPPAVGVTSATLTFAVPNTPGSYNVRFYSKGTYSLIAMSATITAAIANPPSISVTPTSVAPGAPVTVTVANGPGNARDWVGLYSSTAPDTMMLDWKYLNGTRTAPAAGTTSATLTFAMPATPGTYNLRFFANDTLTLLVSSGPVTVQGAVAATTVTVSPAVIAPGGTITAVVANGPGNVRDWIALFPAGAANTLYNAWKYLNGLATPPASGMTSATVTFTAPATSGSYNVRLFSNDSYTLVATSPNFTIDGVPPTVSISSPAANAAVAGTISITASASDNVAVAGVQFKLDGANLGPEVTTAPFGMSWNTAAAANGAHTISAAARDTAGNTAASAAVSVTVLNGGAGPLISGVSASAITNSGATITWVTNIAADSDVEYGQTPAYGGFGTRNPALTTAHSVTLSGLGANTLYHYRARSTDASGNLALSGDFTFTTLASDATPPTVSITAPAPNANLSGIVAVSANAADNVGVVGVQFLVDGAALGVEVLGAPYSTSWDTTTTYAGGHTVAAVARDAAGNRATSAGVSVTTVGAGQVTVAWDPVVYGALGGYNVYVGQTTGHYTMKINASNVSTFTVTGLAPGQTYFFAVTAYDTNGLESGFSNEVSTVVGQ